VPTFTDAAGREWTIQFDGLLLANLREAHKIDLADITGDTYERLYCDQSLLTVAIAFLCGEQLQSHGIAASQLSKSIYGEAAERAWDALWRAAKVFFRPKLWSVLEPALTQRIRLAEQWPAMAPLVRLMGQEIPEGMREVIAAEIAAASSSSHSMASESAAGPAATLPTSAFASPASAESTPAA
jgi:hypothetical protein